ncbi:tRNA (adenosine(37)-N6)-dimethylallyltransferase [Aquirufa echingensis]|jgi:tRNA dimethylallyltransferase|uniref:tRNA dimethylallyltransferase n=1 Tax=Aquirufa echingensis TaxID=3096516 RepID=A0ABW6CZ47_9BACT
MENKVLVLLGPTASGKTSLAVALANKLDGEIVSADSRQIYQGMDIGTGKDLAEYRNVPYHLIDNHQIGDVYSVAHFQKEALDAIQEIASRGKLPIVCGGTGLYLESLINQFQFSHMPDFLEESLSYDLDFQVFGLNPALEVRRERISNRLHQRLKEGLVEEVQALLGHGISQDALTWMGLEYKWAVNFLNGEISRDRFEQGLEVAIHQFAKRQMTYFRKMEKAGINITWIPDALDFQGKSDFVIKNL